MIWLLTLAFAGGPTPLQEHMQGHFANATDAMWFTATGDLEGVKREAAELAHPPPKELPPELIKLAKGMQQQATTLSTAKDLGAAASGISGITSQCAACHTAADKGPEDDDGVGKLASAGAPHLWGVYGLWVGLILPDDKAWDEGVALMKKAPVSAHPKHELVKEQAADLDKRMDAAAKAKTHAERVDAFGALLGTCASCHAAVEIPL